MQSLKKQVVIKMEMNNIREERNSIHIKTTENFKELSDREVKELCDKIYDDIKNDPQLLNDMKNVMNAEVIEYSNSNRKTPEYAPGFLDKPYLQGGIPIREKDLALYNAVLSENFGIIEVEGGVRGGKDVNLLLAVSRKLLVSPDPVALILGSSLEHALRTVLMAGGFGLFYTLPHGTFIRSSDSGGQRGIYKFLDSYGVEKQVLFYGNEKENDSNKFQGFNGIGLVYVNETLNQHLKGLEQGINRLGTAKSPLMVMTQNPKGDAHDFYQKFEKPKLASESEIILMEFVRDNFKDAFDQFENKIKQDRDKERTREIKKTLSTFGKSSFEALTKSEQIAIQKLALDINYKYDAIIRSLSVDKFFDTLKKQYAEEGKDTSGILNIQRGDYLYGKSMKKVVNFFRGFDNPNNVKNSYNFAYFHYTIDDNISVNEMQRNDWKASRTPGTAIYDQEVRGIRRSAEGAVYSMFNEKNIVKFDLDTFKFGDTMRLLVIDPGFNHPTGITDWSFDSEKGVLIALQERKIDFKVEYIDQKNLDVIYNEALKLIRKLDNRRRPDMIIVDPSKPELINYFENHGWDVYPANNRTWTNNKDQVVDGNQNLDKNLIGIPLVQVGFAKGKILVHEGCVELIKEIGSYSYEDNEKGKDDVQKLGDDLVVTIKYAANTVGLRPEMWEEELNSNEAGTLYSNEKSKNEEWDLERERERIRQKRRERQGTLFGESGGFFSRKSGGKGLFS
jgi:hypothetical protein